MAAAFTVDLPSLDGPVEAGIAANVDPALPESEKLQVVKSATQAETATMTAARMLAVLTAANKDEVSITWLVNGAYMAIHGNLLGEIEGKRDGDWRFTTSAESGVVATQDDLRKVLDGNIARKCLTLMVASKVNFWVMNHHTGQRVLQGYAKKVCNVIFGDFSPDMAPETRMVLMHQLGHWCSTLIILKHAGVPSILSPVTIGRQWTTLWSLADDARIRVESNPAGTAKLFVAHAIALRLVAHPLFPFCPSSANMAALEAAVSEVRHNKARYHIGAQYLTGEPRIPLNVDGSAHLGRLISFARAFMPTSTLIQSPVVTQVGGTTRAQTLETNYDDFDSEWATTCTNVAAQIARKRPAVDRVVKALDQVEIGVAQSQGIKEVIEAFYGTSATATRLTNQAAKIIEVYGSQDEDHAEADETMD